MLLESPAQAQPGTVQAQFAWLLLVESSGWDRRLRRRPKYAGCTRVYQKKSGGSWAVIGPDNTCSIETPISGCFRLGQKRPLASGAARAMLRRVLTTVLVRLGYRLGANHLVKPISALESLVRAEAPVPLAQIRPRDSERGDDALPPVLDYHLAEIAHVDTRSANARASAQDLHAAVGRFDAYGGRAAGNSADRPMGSRSGLPALSVSFAFRAALLYVARYPGNQPSLKRSPYGNGRRAWPFFDNGDSVALLNTRVLASIYE